jgi:hypothetical protein
VYDGETGEDEENRSAAPGGYPGIKSDDRESRNRCSDEGEEDSHSSEARRRFGVNLSGIDVVVPLEPVRKAQDERGKECIYQKRHKRYCGNASRNRCPPSTIVVAQKPIRQCKTSGYFRCRPMALVISGVAVRMVQHQLGAVRPSDILHRGAFPQLKIVQGATDRFRDRSLPPGIGEPLRGW